MQLVALTKYQRWITERRPSAKGVVLRVKDRRLLQAWNTYTKEVACGQAQRVAVTRNLQMQTDREHERPGWHPLRHATRLDNHAAVVSLRVTRPRLPNLRLYMIYWRAAR